MKQNTKRVLALAAALSLLLGLLAGCSPKAEAATMHLKRTEGTVGVSNDEGKDLEPAENLGLYSGYGVDTKGASYAWIDLDEVKLTKMDENSQVEIVKEGRHLTIEVKSGSLFFNVTKPLDDDETLDIRTSTMVVGIRGTCGWVDTEQNRVGLLKGAVVCRTEDGAEAVLSAGELAELGGDGQFAVTSLVPEDVPVFIQDEVEEDVLPTPPPEESTPPDGGPLTVLSRQTVNSNKSGLLRIVDYFYDEEGYIQRRVYSTGREGNLVTQNDLTYDFDKEAGRGRYTLPDGTTHEIPYRPGTANPISGFADGGEYYIVTDPLVTAGYDKRDRVGPDGRMDLITEHQSDNEFYNSGYYMIYTMDENDYPVYIETYTPDGTLTGTCTLEWKIIE